MKVSIKVEGLKECEAALDDLINTVGVSRATGKNTVRRALKYALEPIRTAMERLAPVRRGHLKKSIAIGTGLTKRQKSQHKKESPVEVFVGASNLPQAHLQEFGTARQPPQPFGRPAVDSNIAEVTERFVSQLKIEISKTAERHERKARRLLAKST